jgi:hypothetical protein
MQLLFREVISNVSLIWLFSSKSALFENALGGKIHPEI